MNHEINQAAQQTTIEGNLSAINACVSKLKQNISLGEEELHDCLNLLEDAVAVVKTQLATRAEGDFPRRWNVSNLLERTDSFFVQYPKIYYSIISFIFASYILMLTIFAVEG